MIAIASAKISAIIMESNILGAAEGLRPNARMEAYPTAAITAEGPKVLIAIIRITIRLFIAEFASFLTPL